jgi:alpha-D-ribose 1-methylphosphonate 5-triphosphate diphosphatase PhnM
MVAGCENGPHEYNPALAAIYGQYMANQQQMSNNQMQFYQNQAQQSRNNNNYQRLQTICNRVGNFTYCN